MKVFRYEYEDLRNDELQKLDEVSDWIKELREKKSI
jgi:protein-tyrosine phosphatase